MIAITLLNASTMNTNPSQKKRVAEQILFVTSELTKLLIRLTTDITANAAPDRTKTRKDHIINDRIKIPIIMATTWGFEEVINVSLCKFKP